MSDWQNDKQWSDGLTDNVKSLLGLYLIGEAQSEDDEEKNTDLIVMKMEAVRIACRIRRHQYFVNPQYRQEFTLRSERPNGTKTELAKILEGWGDYFFYGFSSEDGQTLVGYTLSDLKPFRYWFFRHLAAYGGVIPGHPQDNKDGSSKFRVFKWADMPEEMIVSQSLSAWENA